MSLHRITAGVLVVAWTARSIYSFRDARRELRFGFRRLGRSHAYAGALEALLALTSLNEFLGGQ